MAGVLEYALSLRTAGFDNPMKNAQASLKKFETSASSVGSGLSGLSAALVGAGIVIGAFVAATAGALAVLRGYAEYDGLVKGMATIEKSAAGAQNRIEQLREVAKQPGLGFEEAVRGDIRLRAAGISAAISEKALRGFGNALAAVGGGKAELQGVILALSQISSKGKVSAEEINQLAERLPQIRSAMKAAFGTSDTEALDKMGIKSEEFINKITEEFGKLPKVMGGAQNTLDNFGDGWKQLKVAALEFWVPMSSSWINGFTSAMQQASKDLKFFKDLFVGGDISETDPAAIAREKNREEEREKIRKAFDDKKAAEKAAAESAKKVAEDEAAFKKKMADERAAYEDQRRQENEKRDLDSQKRIQAATQGILAARLGEEKDIERQIADLKAEAVGDAGTLKRSPNLEVQAAIAERTEKIVTLEKRLSEIKATGAAAEEAKLKAAESKAEAAEKEITARNKAAGLFAQEGALLEAKAAGQTKLVATLERQAKVEQLKLELMEKQGLASDEAAAAAEKRIALEERAANPQRKRGLLDEAASQARRAERRSQADKDRDTRLGRTGSNADKLALADFERRQNRPLSPAAAAAQLARGTAGADPGKNRREERAKAEEKAANPLLAVVKDIQEKFSKLATA